ncbi:MAG: hypothetical protein A3K19_27600 [Lentisphaerae bacterium RIFOXYB12_FULL_65_16]|nr:MAG: hypothetical protein A3K18_24970 [Lentisphaerae bacterium RIFOXYA12_64_32]OGV86069.1 MAG: hypothetical protein A3K19_27600 [Lentisphaerae bacterium RIFOXYB12_FULL_65_16]
MTVESVIQNALGRVFPAAQVVVRCRGQVVLARADGWLDPEARQQPVQDDTRFDLGSVTKLFVATVFMTLVEDGRVGLDEPVCSVLPEFDGLRPLRTGEAPRGTANRADSAPPTRGATADAGCVTFRQLLTHSSGLPAWRPLFREIDGGPAAVRNAVLQTWFAYPPGTRTVYSDLGFALLGFAIERLTGFTLDDAVRQRVTAPLRLDHTGYVPIGGAPAADDIAPTELCPWRQRRVKGEVHDETAAALGGVAGHAGLFSTASDVAAFGQAFLLEEPAKSENRPARTRAFQLGCRTNSGAPASSRALNSTNATDPEGVHVSRGDASSGPPKGGTTSLGRSRSEVRSGALAPRLLRATTIAEMTRPQGEGDTARRGLGFALWSADADASGQPFSPRAFGHTGFTGTTLWVDPARELVVACLTNRVYYGRDPRGIAAFRIALHRAVVDAVDCGAAIE